MQALTVRTIQAESHPEVKMLFWYLFAGSRGGPNRIRIMSLLKNRPFNTNQLSIQLNLDYKATLFHIQVLEKNSVIAKVGDGYGTTYFPSTLFESNQQVFDEIVIKLGKS